MLQIDQIIYSFINSFNSEIMTKIVLIITNCASFWYFTGIIILAFTLLKNKKYGILMTINLIVSFILNWIIKEIIERPRPTEINLIEELGKSFPSAHAMLSLTFYGLIIYFVSKNVKNKKIKYVTTVGLTILILLIGASRIYLGVHFATDVIGGYVIGFIYLLLFIKIINNNSFHLYK